MTKSNKNMFFVLGAPDPEMKEIERICRKEGIAFGYATFGGSVVHSYEAYNADGVTALISGENPYVVFVECSVMGLNYDDVIDHHNEGDPGFGKSPAEYLAGSSLGQFLSMIGLTPTPQQLIIAAADHCLTSAYQGLCPSVDPQDLRDWREATRSLARKIPLENLREQIEQATVNLKAAPRVVMDGTEVAWLENEPPAETSEASARLALAYMYVKRQSDGRRKAGIRSAPAAAVAYWIKNCGLKNIYGDPQRGFAGGYQ